MKDSESPVWWDRGRARWTARPHRKERSYQEGVGGNPGRSGEGLRRERHAGRQVLARYAAGSELVRECLEDAVGAPLPSSRRWKTSGRRGEVLLNQRLRRVRNTGRKLLVVTPFYLPYALRLKLLRMLGAAFTPEVDAALCAATEAQWARRRYHFYASVRATRLLARGPLLCRLFPKVRAHRWVVARALVSALSRHGDDDQHERFASLLWALVADDGCLAPLHARRWGAVLGYADPLHTLGRLNAQHDREMAALAWRALEASPRLRAQFEDWLERNSKRPV